MGEMTRIPPQHLEAEQAVLGGILLHNESILDAREVLSGEEFYRAAHRAIFAAVVSLFDRKEPCDLVTLKDHLQARGQLNEAGGASYLAQLLDATPSAANVTHYAKIVKEKALRRQVLSTARQLAENATNEETPIEEVIAQGFGELSSIDHHGGNGRFRDMRILTKDAIKRIEARATSPTYASGVSTGFRALDKITNGLQSSDLVIIAGRPSMGKSAIAQQMAEHGARQAGPVVFFSLEMDADALTDRFLSNCARIPSQRIRSGRLQEVDWSRLVSVAGQLADLPLVLIDKPALTAQQIRFMARQASHRMGYLTLVVIDYLQLIRPDRREKQRYLEVGEITRTLKELAREIKAPVVLLSQLNRSCEQRENKRPLLSDLRESGDIEQDADLVMFLYRDEYYCPVCSKRKGGCSKGHQGLAEVIVAKQRKGPTGTVTLTWLEQFTRFEDRAHE
jgi:replicative DNA helicase